MNKTLLTVGIVIIIALAVWGIWHFASSGTNAYAPLTESTTTAPAGSPSSTSSSGSPSVTTQTFHSIFSQSGNHECTYESVGGASVKSSNVIYIADGKMRGEFRTTTSTSTSANLMIYSGGLLYTWKEGTTRGTITSIKTLADLPTIIPGDLTSGKILGGTDESVGWDCHDWSKDSEMFVIPDYVTFSYSS